MKCFFTEFGRDCLKKLERLGDEALESCNYGEAIKQYTAVKPLIGDLDLKHDLLLKRSDAHAKIDPPNWREALDDAEEVQSCLHIHTSYMILCTFLPGNQIEFLFPLGLRQEACSVVYTSILP